MAYHLRCGGEKTLASEVRSKSRTECVFTMFYMSVAGGLGFWRRYVFSSTGLRATKVGPIQKTCFPNKFIFIFVGLGLYTQRSQPITPNSRYLYHGALSTKHHGSDSKTTLF